MGTIFYSIMKISVVAILASLAESISAEDEEMKATTIAEPPYVMTKTANPTNNDDFEGYIPDLIEELAHHTKCNCTFNLQLVKDGKYGVKQDAHRWNGMIGEVDRQEAHLIAAPITFSDERDDVLDFTEHFMTFETVVLMKKASSMKRINSASEMFDHPEIKYGLVKDGFTEKFFKDSDETFYQDMYKKMDKTKFPNTSREGVRKVQQGDGKYAFIIDSSTADYWVNKEPCDLYSFRLGSALECHKYALAVKDLYENHELVEKLENTIKALKSEGTLERLKAKWWPHECSAAAAVFSIAEFNVLLVTISIITARRLI